MWEPHKIRTGKGSGSTLINNTSVKAELAQSSYLACDHGRGLLRKPRKEELSLSVKVKQLGGDYGRHKVHSL